MFDMKMITFSAQCDVHLHMHSLLQAELMPVMVSDVGSCSLHRLHRLKPSAACRQRMMHLWRMQTSAAGQKYENTLDLGFEPSGPTCHGLIEPLADMNDFVAQAEITVV